MLTPDISQRLNIAYKTLARKKLIAAMTNRPPVLAYCQFLLQLLQAEIGYTAK